MFIEKDVRGNKAASALNSRNKPRKEEDTILTALYLKFIQWRV